MVAIHNYFFGFELRLGFFGLGLAWALFGCALVVHNKAN
jgi:hypothetical protein